MDGGRFLSVFASLVCVEFDRVIWLWDSVSVRSEDGLGFWGT